MKSLNQQRVVLTTQDIASEFDTFLKNAAIQQLISASEVIADMYAENDVESLPSKQNIIEHAVSMLEGEHGDSDLQRQLVQAIVEQIKSFEFDVTFTIERGIVQNKFKTTCRIGLLVP